MSAQHTSGPWAVGTTCNTHDHPTRFWRTYVGKGKVIAQTFGASQEEAEEIARLIAAAPDLLQALRDAVACLGGINSDNVPESVRASIEKAKPPATHS